ncbi:hypothetical protein [Roseibium denhamense]|uniref:hypothetical protein n=1 Tax=Roseibium denhamense TaxID=76305 RepID=UPI0031383EBF
MTANATGRQETIEYYCEGASGRDCGNPGSFTEWMRNAASGTGVHAHGLLFALRLSRFLTQMTICHISPE